MIDNRRTFRTGDLSNRNSARITDPLASFNNVQEHFEKIQANFTTMREGITHTKT